MAIGAETAASDVAGDLDGAVDADHRQDVGQLHELFERGVGCEDVGVVEADGAERGGFEVRGDADGVGDGGSGQEGDGGLAAVAEHRTCSEVTNNGHCTTTGTIAGSRSLSESV